MRKIITGALAALTLVGAAATTTEASARGWYGGEHGGWHGGWHGGGVAAGVIGGLALGAAIGARPYYGYPYSYGPPCTAWRWDPYLHRNVPVRTWC